MFIFKKFSFILLIFLFATKILSQDFVLDQITVSANKINTPIDQTVLIFLLLIKIRFGRVLATFF